MAAPPIQQVPFEVAAAEERVASSSSLDEEIDKFQFEEEEIQGVETIFISEVAEETDRYSCVQTLAPVITYVEDSSDDEVEEMASKSNKSLRELMKGQHEIPYEGKIGPSNGNKQQKVTQDQRGKRSFSVESREGPFAADVRRTPRIWSPKLELDGAPFAWDTSVRSYQGGQAGHIAEALEQPFLLPRDMDAYRRFSQ